MATVQQYLTDWLTLRASSLKPRTVESYADLFRRYAFPALGASDVAALDPSDVTHLLAAIVAAGHTRTAELLYVALKAAFRPLEVNPLHRVPRPRHSQQTPPAWNDEQIAQYMGALVGHKHQLPLTLGIVLGLRRGEICGLKWEDVDFDENVIHIRRQLVRLDSGDLIECSPKSASSVRDLPIPLGLQTLLKARRQLPACRLCPLTPSGLDAAHRALARRLTLPYTPLHGLRHSFATSCIRNGGEMKSLQLILGHSNYAVTANRYTHPDMKMLQKAVDFATRPCYTFP